MITRRGMDAAHQLHAFTIELDCIQCALLSCCGTVILFTWHNISVNYVFVQPGAVTPKNAWPGYGYGHGQKGQPVWFRRHRRTGESAKMFREGEATRRCGFQAAELASHRSGTENGPSPAHTHIWSG